MSKKTKNHVPSIRFAIHSQCKTVPVPRDPRLVEHDARTVGTPRVLAPHKQAKPANLNELMELPFVCYRPMIHQHGVGRVGTT